MKSYLYDGAKSVKLGKYLSQLLPGLQFSSFRRMLSDGRIAVNGKRVKKEVFINPGDEIKIFSEDGIPSFKSERLYEDDDVMIAVKPRGTETRLFAKLVSAESGAEYIPVHRLDTNTRGILIFAKNEKAFEDAVSLFRSSSIEKYYVALLGGVIEKEGVFNAFLKKDSEKGSVEISDAPQKGFVPIKTGIRPIEIRDGELTYAEIRLYTGKTHQIRAHAAHLGHPVVGDTKYGDFDLNRLMRAKRQYLTAYKLVFGNIPKGNRLSRLGGKKFEITPDF